jgi:hypothetical protein
MFMLSHFFSPLFDNTAQQTTSPHKFFHTGMKSAGMLFKESVLP